MKSPNPIRVLIVDDEPNMTLTLATGLRKLGKQYIVDTANSGQEAINRIRQIEYALVITDYQMPGMNGSTLVQKIQQICPETLVILMSGHGTEDFRRDLVKGLQLEAYLDKPFEIAQIRQIVKTAVTKTQRQIKAPPPIIQKRSKKVLSDCLKQFRTNTGARCVLVLSNSGHVIETAGDTADLDTNGISALVAANFLAGVELARLLGNKSVFKRSYHEGPNYNIYAYGIDSNFLLAIIFGRESKQGIIRFYVGKLVDNLMPLLAVEKLPSMESLDDEFSQSVNADLDNLFSGSFSQGA